MAIRTACLYAKEANPVAVVLMDGDHQHHAEDIPRLAERVLADEADFVIGVRWGKTSGMPMYRRVWKRVLDYATAAGAKNGKLTDSQSGLRGFSRMALFAIEPPENSLSIESQMLLEAQENDLRIDEVNAEFQYDLQGSNVTPGRHGVSVLGRVPTIVAEQRPLLFFGMGGVAFVAVASILGVYTLQIYYSTSVFALGYAFLVVLFGLAGGVTSIFVGVMLNGVTKILRAQRTSSR